MIFSSYGILIFLRKLYFIFFVKKI
jgi:hypothetical protein